MRRLKYILPAVVVFIALLVTFFVLGGFVRSERIEVHALQGEIDLRPMDFLQEVIELPGSSEWEYYPGVLYEPSDFASGNTGEPSAYIEKRDKGITTGTYRLKLLLPENKILALRFNSVDYASRLYINGKIALEAGTVSDNPDEMEPRIRYASVPLYTDDGEVELIVQYANFVHFEGGNLRPMLLSTLDNLDRAVQLDMLPIYMLHFGLLVLGLYHLLNFFASKRKEVLYFSLCCILLSIRNNHFFLQMVSVDYTWLYAIRLLYIGNITIFFLFALLLSTVSPNRFHRNVLRAFGLVTILFILLILFLPSLIFTRIQSMLSVVLVPFLAYYLIKGTGYIFGHERGDRVAFTGLFTLVATSIFDLVYRGSLPVIGSSGLMTFGILIFVMCYMLVLSMRASEADRLLGEAKSQVKALQELDRMKTDFLGKISHELKTPLQVVSSYAQYTNEFLDSPEHEEARDNQRHIILETDRMKRMVHQLLDVAAAESAKLRLNLKSCCIQDLIEELATDYFPMLDLNNNRLALNMDESIPEVTADAERIRQVIINLLSNATRATKDGLITIKAEKTEDTVLITVTDTGTGIEPEIKNELFSRYLTNSGNKGLSAGTGLGLYISKEIIIAHGGSIAVESEVGKGTSVTFSLPLYRKEHSYDKQ